MREDLRELWRALTWPKAKLVAREAPSRAPRAPWTDDWEDLGYFDGR